MTTDTTRRRNGNAPSRPGHCNQVVLIGVCELVHGTRGCLTAVLLTVATGGDPCKVIVVPPPTPPAVRRGDLVWVMGRLPCDPAPERKALHFIEAAHLEVIQRQEDLA